MILNNINLVCSYEIVVGVGHNDLVRNQNIVMKNLYDI